MTNHHQVLMTADKAAEMGCTPLAKIVGYADGATDPIDFPIAPKFALDKLMAQVPQSEQYKGNILEHIAQLDQTKSRFCFLLV